MYVLVNITIHSYGALHYEKLILYRNVVQKFIFDG